MHSALISLAVVLLALPRILESTSLVVETQGVVTSLPVPKEPEEEEIPWYAKVSMFHFPQMFAVDVAGPNLLPALAKATAEYVLVDFYAPWCPHCQHFAPDFERLSLATQQLQKRAHAAPSIFLATVDCVRFSATCKEWGVQGYPTLRWGKRSDWLGESAKTILDTIDVRPIDAESVADWIKTHISVDLNPLPTRSDLTRLAPPPVPSAAEVEVGAHASSVSGADVRDAQLASALFVHIALEDQAFRGKPKAVLLDFVSLLAKQFPVEAHGHKRCQRSFVTLGDTLRSVETDKFDTDLLEKTWQPCGIPYSEYAKGWYSCRGTWPGKRGFTCGLWTLFHMLAARSNDASAELQLQTLRATVGNFFNCKECRDHFLAIPIPANHAKKTLTRREVQLWWWNTHNIVNRRVMKLEEHFDDADVGFPKLSWWPSAEVCPKCRKASSFMRFQKNQKTTEIPTVEDAVQDEGWDLDEVGAFLDRFYGGGAMLH